MAHSPRPAAAQLPPSFLSSACPSLHWPVGAAEMKTNPLSLPPLPPSSPPLPPQPPPYGDSASLLDLANTASIVAVRPPSSSATSVFLQGLTLVNAIIAPLPNSGPQGQLSALPLWAFQGDR